MKSLTRFVNLLFVVGWMLVIIMSSCQSNDKNEQEENVQNVTPVQSTEVNTVRLKKSDFKHELLSNGRVTARLVAEMKFLSEEPISKIYVRNGDHVVKGQLLASLDTFRLSNKMLQTRDALERSKLEMKDILIGQGYQPEKVDGIPDKVMELAKVKSGYNSAETQFQLAQHELQGTRLKAPINGTIANLFAKEQSFAKTSEVFCNIVDPGSLEVSFTVLESELAFIQKGDPVKIVAFSMPDVQVEGRVSEINPWVDPNGMVQVKASIAYNKHLVEGMNVRVSAYRSAGQKWVVPKSAILLRNGKQVLFTADQGRAIWHYVETGLENATQYSITSETLKEGDAIIISNNINLAHESPISVKEKKQ